VSAFVAIGALLGVKVLWRDSKHIVALDADAMNDGLGVGDGLAFRFDLFVAHDGDFSMMAQGDHRKSEGAKDISLRLFARMLD
jgi:hypothetical protein